MSSVDESLAKLGSSKIFTKLDANRGFWQLHLDDESRLLTTFIAPYGRYCFNRLPFGIRSAPEIFQRTMSIILEGLDGVICHMDDILVHSVDETTHNQNVRAVLSRLQEAGLTLNANKCEFAKHSTTFLGHIIDGPGIQADPRKTTAVKKLSYAYHCPRAATVHGHGEPAGEVSPGLGGLQRAAASTASQRHCLVVGRRARAVLSAFKRQPERDRDPCALRSETSHNHRGRRNVYRNRGRPAINTGR